MLYWRMAPSCFGLGLAVCGVFTFMASCGGSLNNPGATADAGDRDAGDREVGVFIEASVADVTCSFGSDCAESADGGGDRDAIDAQRVGEGGASEPVLCSYRKGPLDAGTDAAGGPALLCMPGWLCVPLSGAWACCTAQGSGGTSICDQPFLTDAG